VQVTRADLGHAAGQPAHIHGRVSLYGRTVTELAGVVPAPALDAAARRQRTGVIPARGKVAGAYANSSLIKSDAIQSGYDEALVLDQNGHVSEGSAMNVFMVRDGVLITPPVTDNILEGIMRRTVMELARKELGIDVVERSIDRTEVFIADELFFSGTAAQVTVITQVDHRPVGSGKIGPIAGKLRELVENIVRARIPKYTDWNVEV